MTAAVYILCGVTSLLCAVLLLRGYRQRGLRLLLWSGLCFVGLAVDNLALIVDIIILPELPLEEFRVAGAVAALAGLVLLIYGLVWDVR
jgi:hypothetical protein